MQEKYFFKCSQCNFITTFDSKPKQLQIVKHMQETAKKEGIGHIVDSSNNNEQEYLILKKKVR